MNQSYLPHYIPGFDYLRILAVFAVVWIHGSDTHTLALDMQRFTIFAVPCFVLLSGFLTQQSINAYDKPILFSTFLYSRFKRLLPAYFFWSFLYLLMRSIKHYFITDNALNIEWGLAIFGGGASYQLWYIPALVLWLTIFGYLAIRCTPFKNQKHYTAFLILLGIGLMISGKLMANLLIIPDKYTLIIKATLAYTGYFPFAMGIALLNKASLNKKTLFFKYSTVFLFILLIVIHYSKLNSIPTLRIPLISIGLFLFSLQISKKIDWNFFSVLSKYAFGIYLCHAFFIEGLQMLFPKLGIDLNTFVGTLFVILTAFILSAILCLILGTKKSTRWLVV